jgi:hypothetical protein
MICKREYARQDVRITPRMRQPDRGWRVIGTIRLNNKALFGSLSLAPSLHIMAMMLSRAAFVPIAFASLAALMLVACGSLSGDGQDGSAPEEAGGAVDAGRAKDASNRLDSTARETSSESGDTPGCPTAIPEDGAACTRGAAPPASDPPSEVVAWVCEYGSDPHCNTYAQCVSGGGGFSWLVSPPDPSCAGNPPACPEVLGADAGHGGECPIQGSCTYSEGKCSCTSCKEEDGESGTDWICGGWQTPTGCPEPRPLLGSACASEGLECDYGGSCCAVLDLGPDMLCTGGYWALIEEKPCECPADICGD